MDEKLQVIRDELGSPYYESSDVLLYQGGAEDPAPAAGSALGDAPPAARRATPASRPHDQTSSSSRTRGTALSRLPRLRLSSSRPPRQGRSTGPSPPGQTLDLVTAHKGFAPTRKDGQKKSHTEPERVLGYPPTRLDVPTADAGERLCPLLRIRIPSMSWILPRAPVGGHPGHYPRKIHYRARSTTINLPVSPRNVAQYPGPDQLRPRQRAHSTTMQTGTCASSDFRVDLSTMTIVQLTNHQDPARSPSPLQSDVRHPLQRPPSSATPRSCY